MAPSDLLTEMVAGLAGIVFGRIDPGAEGHAAAAQPLRLAIVGGPGSGKFTVAHAVAATFNLQVRFFPHLGWQILCRTYAVNTMLLNM